MAKPRLLFLAQLLPYPPDGGAPIRTYNILRLLAEHYDITLLCFYRRSVVRNLASSHEALSGVADTTTFRIEQEFNRVRLVVDHLRSLLRGRVYTEFVYESADFRQALHQALNRHRFDLIHVDSLDLSGYLPALGDIPVVCVHHNVESQLLARRALLAGGRALRWYMRRQAELMQEAEARWASRVALNVVVSAADGDRLASIAPTARIAVVPNGVDAVTFRPGPPQDERGILYVGGLNWFPNRDALDYLAEDILPRLRQQAVSDAVTWVGHASPSDQTAFAANGIDLKGYVDDVRPYVHQAACFIVPLRVGGGTRLKILDAWAMGKAIVSTSIGCEGLAAVDGHNILIRDDPDGFAAAVREVLANAPLRASLGANARQTVEQTYAWPIIGEQMMRSYHSITR